MRGTDGIEASLLHQLGFAIFRLVVGSSAQDTIVMMDAGSIEFQGLAIEQQSATGIILDGPDAIADADLVTTRCFKFRLVQIGIVGRP